jgi:predicted ATPase
LHNVSLSLQLAGDREGTLAAAQRAVALAEKFGLFAYVASSLVLAAWGSAAGSGIADAAGLIDAKIAPATAAGPVPQYYLGVAADVLLAAGRAGEALAYLDRAIAGVDEPGVGFYLPEIYRLRGECLLAVDRGNNEKARQAFKTAADIARRQGAIVFQRRAEASVEKLAG